MTSFIHITRCCEFCSKEFIAKTTVTRFCSNPCRNKFNKGRIREVKIKGSDEEMMKMKILQQEEVKRKEFLTVRNVAMLLSCSVRTVYYLIENNTLEAVNIGQRMTRVKRSSIDKLLIKPVPAEQEPIEYKLEDCMATRDIRLKYQISESALRDLIIRNKIPKLRKGKLAYIPKVLIEKYLGEPQKDSKARIILEL